MKKLFCLVLLCFSTSAFAGFSEGFAAYQSGDYATALKEWRLLAEQGDALAQYNLALMYSEGRGVEKNDGEAAKWFTKAAEQGDAIAQNRLGLMYGTGNGVEENEVEAIRWLRKAAEQGDAIPIGNVGWYTANGWGTKKNLVEGERLLKLSVSKGSDWAKEKLKLVQEMSACQKKASTLIFGEALNCTSKNALRQALKAGGLKATREDDGYWYDTYDSSEALEGSSGLSVAYVKGKFARSFYEFNSSMNTGKVAEVRNMVVSKYGQPTTSSGNVSVGEVSYTWKLKDGIKVEVSRGWPNTSVTLAYIHPVNFTAMEAEQARQKEEKEAAKYNKQNKAF
ncbi:MAG: tetratricopeptide repeat protein [Gallionellaceae bacterium]